MKCPGQDSRYWKPGYIFEAQCPKCNEMVEFFKDDPTRKCPGCGHKFVNPELDFGCAAYCKYADQCIGELPPELLAERQELMKDRIAVEMKKYFNKDFKSIGHATRVARHAEAVAGEEKGDMAVILAAAYLLGIDALKANCKEGAVEKNVMENKGPSTARTILEKAGAKEQMTEEVCNIISDYYGCGNDTDAHINFKIVCDADLIARLEEEYKEKQISFENIQKIIETRFYTNSGKKRAKKIF